MDLKPLQFIYGNAAVATCHALPRQTCLASAIQASHFSLDAMVLSHVAAQCILDSCAVACLLIMFLPNVLVFHTIHEVTTLA